MRWFTRRCHRSLTPEFHSGEYHRRGTEVKRAFRHGTLRARANTWVRPCGRRPDTCSPPPRREHPQVRIWPQTDSRSLVRRLRESCIYARPGVRRIRRRRAPTESAHSRGGRTSHLAVHSPQSAPRRSAFGRGSHRRARRPGQPPRQMRLSGRLGKPKATAAGQDEGDRRRQANTVPGRHVDGTRP